MPAATVLTRQIHAKGRSLLMRPFNTHCFPKCLQVGAALPIDGSINQIEIFLGFRCYTVGPGATSNTCRKQQMRRPGSKLQAFFKQAVPEVPQRLPRSSPEAPGSPQKSCSWKLPEAPQDLPEATRQPGSPPEAKKRFYLVNAPAYTKTAFECDGRLQPNSTWLCH